MPAEVVQKSTEISASKAAMSNLVRQHTATDSILHNMLAGPKDYTAWINSCALDMAALVIDLPYSVAYLASTSGDNMRSFKHAINNVTQPNVILQHTTQIDANFETSARLGRDV